MWQSTGSQIVRCNLATEQQRRSGRNDSEARDQKPEVGGRGKLLEDRKALRESACMHGTHGWTLELQSQESLPSSPSTAALQFSDPYPWT